MHQILERGCAHVGFEAEELWTQYLGLCGNEPIDRIRAFLDGSSIPSRREYDVMAHCVNERLVELGVAAPLPYGDELDL